METKIATVMCKKQFLVRRNKSFLCAVAWRHGFGDSNPVYKMHGYYKDFCELVTND